MQHDLRHGDCLAVLPTIPSASVDAVICDPPYPCIVRPYGTLSEAEWFTLMRQVVPECRRVLKPSGSAVFILQPNSERIGKLRPWLWEFMAWLCHEWNVVQDAWWWNPSSLPLGGACAAGLMRPSVKACVWCGPPDCWRDQEAVLWTESRRNVMERAAGRCDRRKYPGGRSVDHRKITASAAERGGVTPFNLLPVANTNSVTSGGAKGHPAGTPLALCSWWCRYICPPGGTVLDPFCGSGTVPLAAVQQGKQAIGIERDESYFQLARDRLESLI